MKHFTSERFPIVRRIIRTWRDEGTVSARIFRNFSITFSGSILLQVIAFIRIPLLLKNISIDDYGRILIAASFFTAISLFINVRVHDLLFRFLPEMEREGDRGAVSALHRLALGICIALSAIILALTFVGGRWASLHLYRDLSLHPLLLISSIYAVFAPFTMYASGVLRLRNRFSWLVAPQVAGGVITLVLLALLFFVRQRNDLITVVWAIALGQMVGAAVPVLLSIWLARKEIAAPGGLFSFTALAPHRRGLIDTLIDTNVLNWLKIGTEKGGLFLLSVFSTPEQVALFGIASRLCQPAILLQSNLQTALNPEIVSLYATRRLDELRRLVRRIFTASALAGLAVLALGLLLIRPVLLVLATPDYLAGVPVFRVYLTAVYLAFISLPFFYLALSMDKLRRRNLVVAVRFLYLGFFVWWGFNALTLALALLLGEITVRLFNDIPLYRELKRNAAVEATSGCG